MDSDCDEGVGPELTKIEAKLIKGIISELSDDPSSITNADELFSLFTKFQVQPEKQLKMMYAVAFELSERSDKSDGEMSEHYLRLSTLATVAVQEKFGRIQKESSSRKGRQAKDNAKINMTSYFDLETTLLNESSDEESSKKKRKKRDKVEWSDSELKETEPAPKPPPQVESINDSDNETEKKIDPPATKSKLSGLQGSRVSQRKRMIDVVCIDSSSDEERQSPPKVAAKEKQLASSKEKTRATPKPQPNPTQKNTAKSAPKRKLNIQSRPKAPPPVTASAVKKLLSASDKTVTQKPAVPPKSTRTDTISTSVQKPPSPIPRQENSTETPTDTNNSTSTAVKGNKSVTTKPVGVVKATQRKVPPDTQRSTKNVIKQDEALILNFKKGHYPTFQTSYTHLVICKKPNNDLYTDTAPQLSVILAMDGQVVPSDDLKNYVLKQFVHNESGQYLVGEKEENLYLLVPGVINKSKEKT